MIISHSQRFVFFAVPKTGTHSLRDVLRAGMIDSDWEQQALFEQVRLPIPEIAALQHGHISVTQIKPHIIDCWHSYFKFAIVRNPYDRFISVCFFLNRKNPDFRANALRWMKSAIRHERFRQRVLVRPQYQQLIDENGELALDYIGRYEKLQESVDAISSRLSLPPVDLSVKNESAHDGFESYYDSELRALVRDFYAKDFAHFGYP